MTFWTNGLLGAITLTIPASVIIAYNGTIASIPSGWYLCDGTNSTPNLTNKFIRCADDSTLNKGATGGSTTGQVTGSSSSEGGHGGIGGAAGTTLGGGGAVQYGTAGAHSHTLTGDMDWKPPSRELIYIKSYTSVNLPANAVVWRNDNSVPSNCSELTDLRDRFILGVGDNSRTQVGSDSRSVTLLTGSAGDHQHPGGNYQPGGGGPGRGVTSGAHVHNSFSDTISVAKPSYHALLAVKIDTTTGKFDKLIVAFDGAVSSIPSGWYLCNGNNTTPNLVGKMPIGKSGTLALGATGGQNTAYSVNGSTGVPSATVTHSHTAPSEEGSIGDHSSYAWAHSHASWSGTADTLPLWHALPYIMYKAA